ncbi:hypothetical protein [Nocardia suismassiliense]|uniref:hypothetical protein n=1 Tax=Nocardia suismassiliense TaxID=2077092 RepID=UPI00131F05F9|nr:hypothetical protein [Nocardia suismassiliense]
MFRLTLTAEPKAVRAAIHQFLWADLKFLYFDPVELADWEQSWIVFLKSAIEHAATDHLIVRSDTGTEVTLVLDDDREDALLLIDALDAETGATVAVFVYTEPFPPRAGRPPTVRTLGHIAADAAHALHTAIADLNGALTAAGRET